MRGASGRLGAWSVLRLYLDGRRRLVAQAMALFIVKASATWVMPVYSGYVIGLVAERPADWPLRLVLATAGILLLIAQNVFTHPLYVSRLSRISRGVGRQLRVAVCRQLQQLSLLYHGRQSAGRLQSKVVRDIDVIESAGLSMSDPLLQGGITLLVALVVAVREAPESLLVMLGLAPVAVWLNVSFSKKLRARAEEHRLMMERLGARLQDMLVMIPLTRAHGLEHVEIERAERGIGHASEAALRFDRTNATFGACSWASLVGVQMIFLGVNVYLAARRGDVQISSLITLNGYFAMIVGTWSGLLGLLPQMSRVRDAYSSIRGVLDEPDVELNQGRPVPKLVRGGVEFRGVTYAYPGGAGPALQDVSLRVAPGEAVAFVGPSGCGKSTALSLAAGLLRATSGEVLIDGVGVNELDMRALRRHVAVVTQQSVFFSGTVRENLTYGEESIDPRRVQEALDLADAAEFVAALPAGLETPLGDGGVRLSGGQNQRLALARALVRDPRILLLDEPTTGLDLESELRFREAMRRVAPGRTVLMVSHGLPNVRGLGRIFVIEGGRLRDAGTHEELLGRESFYSRAYRQLSA